MSDINELIKSGAVPSATPRTSKIFIPEVIVTEPVTSSAEPVTLTESSEMEPKKEEAETDSKIQEVEEDQTPAKKDAEPSEDESKAEVHHARTDSETVSESEKPVHHDAESLKEAEVESTPELKDEEEGEGERQSLKSQSSKPETVHDEDDRSETVEVARHDEEGSAEVVSVNSLENGVAKSEGKQSEGDRASLYLDEEVTTSENGSVKKLERSVSFQLEQQQEEDEEDENQSDEEEYHPSVAEILAAREKGSGPQVIVPKPIGVKAIEAKAEREIQISEVEIAHVKEKVEIVDVEKKLEVSSSIVDEEKGKSNEEVLSKLVEEAENEEDRSHVTNLLKWAKGTRKSKTETMKVREKKREDSFKRAVDVDAVPIIIEYKNKDEKVVQSSQRTFKVITSNGANDPLAQNGAKVENVVTKSWIQSAIRAHEDVTDDVTVVTLNIGRQDSGNHSAKIVAKLGDGADGNRSYDWIIKKTLPKNAAQDKETFITVDLGTKLARFAKKGSAKSVKKEVTGSNAFPLNSLIYSDHSHAVYEDLGSFRAITSEEGLSLDCLKLALKALARVHATSFAYFAKTGDDSAKKVLIDPNYQIISSNAQEKVEAKDKLNRSFENLLDLLRGLGTDGVILADKAKARFGNRLYDIFKDALQPSSNFSVLCHGFPVQADFLFGFDADGQKPVDVRIVNLRQARLAHAVTDVLPLMLTAMGPKVEEQAGFLLRFVYFETLASSLKSFGLENQIDFDSLKKDFKSKETYGALAGAMYLAEIGGKTPIRARGSGTRVSGKRSFTSKLLGSYSSGKEGPEEKQEEVLGSTPASRAKALIEKIVSEF